MLLLAPDWWSPLVQPGGLRHPMGYDRSLDALPFATTCMPYSIRCDLASYVGCSRGPPASSVRTHTS